MTVASEIDLTAIPENQREAVAALMRAHLQLRNETTSLQEIVRRLEHLVAELNQVVHGRRSEKLSEDERQLAFEDLEAAVAAVEAQKVMSDNHPVRRRQPCWPLPPAGGRA